METPQAPDMNRRRFLGLAGAAAASVAAAGAIAGVGSVATVDAAAPLLGSLSAPAFGAVNVFETVADGSQRVIKSSSLNVRGAGHIATTPLPGQRGVSVIAGHRTTSPRPFYNLHKTKVGDLITWTPAGGLAVQFKVVEIAVLGDITWRKATLPDGTQGTEAEATFVEIMDPVVKYGSDTRLNLYACTRPPYAGQPWRVTGAGQSIPSARPTSTSYRLAVFAVKV